MKALLSRRFHVHAVLLEISNILNTGLDRKTLAILVELIEMGVNPEALAEAVKELKREAAGMNSMA